jgi:hypothetical protein
MQLPCNAVPPVRAKLMAIAMSLRLSRCPRRRAAAIQAFMALRRHFKAYPGSGHDLESLLRQCLRDVDSLLGRTVDHMREADEKDMFGWTKALIEKSCPGVTQASSFLGHGAANTAEALVVLLITRAVHADLDHEDEKA